MSARYGTLGDLQKEAAERNIDLSEAEIRWAEIAIFKKACRLVKENRDYPGKMLLCSMRMSPTVDGVVRSWHVEKAAGADIVYTCPPGYLEGLLETGGHLEFRNQIDDPAPQAVMEKLLKIPYFNRGMRRMVIPSMSSTPIRLWWPRPRNFPERPSRWLTLFPSASPILRIILNHRCFTGSANH